MEQNGDPPTSEHSSSDKYPCKVHYVEYSGKDGPRFEPPLYKQRYVFVADTLQSYGITSLIDIGCSECKIFRYLRGVTTLQHVALVDIDSAVLEFHKRCICPLITDYRFSSRPYPLRVEMLAGDITEIDDRLRGFEAISMVEVIEHLTEETLQAFPAVVFGELRPRIIIMTTPNSEFNQLFPGLTGFRHWDHKFEWTRQEFQRWCDHTAFTYGYNVTYVGVGEAPPRSQHLGHCSQAAVFELESEWIEMKAALTKHTPYKLISSSVHPSRPEPLSCLEQLRVDVIYYVNFLTHYEDCDNAGRVYVPIETLRNFIKNLAILGEESQKLVFFLQEEGYDLTDDLSCIIRLTYDPDILNDSYLSELNTTSESVCSDHTPESWDNVVEDSSEIVSES